MRVRREREGGVPELRLAVVTAFSPATNRSYTMYCTTSSPHVCTGGTDAAVYFP